MLCISLANNLNKITSSPSQTREETFAENTEVPLVFTDE